MPDDALTPPIMIALAIVVTFALSGLAFYLGESHAFHNPSHATDGPWVHNATPPNTGLAKLELRNSSLSPVTPQEANLQILLEQGGSHTEVCQTAQLQANDRCERPWSSGQEWTTDEPLWIPCKQKGEHFARIKIEGSMRWQGSFHCP